MKNSIYDVNYLWLVLVFLHLAGSLIVSVMGNLPGGFLILAGSVCLCLYYIYKKRSRALPAVLLTAVLLLFLCWFLPGSYQGSLYLNLFLLVFLLYTTENSRVSLKEYAKIRKPEIWQLGCLFLLTFCCILIAGFLNALSMLFVENYAGSSLSGAADYPLQAILVFAVLPAVMEELIFRGCILKGTGGGWRGILYTAILFALLHMNFNQMSYALFMGIFLGALVWITGNLLSSIIVHLLFNLYSVLLIIFSSSRAVTLLENLKIAGYAPFNGYLVWEESLPQAITAGLLVSGLALLVSIFLLCRMKKYARAKGDAGKKAIPTGFKPDLRFFAGTAMCLLAALILG